jgi:hypothetical protein
MCLLFLLKRKGTYLVQIGYPVQTYKLSIKVIRCSSKRQVEGVIAKFHGPIPSVP